ncbi:hypothetical protein [Streptomyces jumonjinensis]|uniref:hypothetical protein n=1 Tax=Streptomyces jumonjinensis TaxID=1945 RepID=UPI0037A07E0E
MFQLLQEDERLDALLQLPREVGRGQDADHRVLTIHDDREAAPLNAVHPVEKGMFHTGGLGMRIQGVGHRGSPAAQLRSCDSLSGDDHQNRLRWRTA